MEIGMTDQVEERIRERAHQLWERGGRIQGMDKYHWEQAIREIETEDSEAQRGQIDKTPIVASEEIEQFSPPPTKSMEKPGIQRKGTRGQ